MTVKLLSLSARGEESVAVSFELRSGENVQRETFLVSAAFVADHGLTAGDSTQDCYDTVCRGAQVYGAVRRGLNALGYGACSPRGLCRKLMAKGIEREIAEEAVSVLCRGGYLNPSADALREAERGVAKGWGRRRIIGALFSKGYSDEVVREAIYGLEDAGVDFVALCAQRIREQVDAVPSEPAEKRRLIASLERYGFSSSEIRDAVRLLHEEQKND